MDQSRYGHPSGSSALMSLSDGSVRSVHQRGTRTVLRGTCRKNCCIKLKNNLSDDCCFCISQMRPGVTDGKFLEAKYGNEPAKKKKTVTIFSVTVLEFTTTKELNCPASACLFSLLGELKQKT